MIKLFDLYNRIIETTGLDVMTLGSLKAAMANCMADLTSRGYKAFKEYHLSDFTKVILEPVEIDPSNIEESELYLAHDFDTTAKTEYTKGMLLKKVTVTGEMDEETGIQPTETKYYLIEEVSVPNYKVNQNYIEMDLPKDIRKAVYLRVFFGTNATLASRWSLSNKRVGCRYFNGEFRSMIDVGQAIYYTKGDKLYIEWHTSLGEELTDISFGYYQKLTMPSNFPDNPDDVEAMLNYEIDIRDEFADALVLYAAYFYYSRYIKDTDKINHYLSQYKYYIEDITHELSYEDEFNEEDAVIKIED